MKEKQNKSLTRRFVEANKKFRNEIKIIHIGGSIGIFISVFVISYFLFDSFDKSFIFNTIIVTLFFTILTGISTLTLQPKILFIFVIILAILISGIFKVI